MTPQERHDEFADVAAHFRDLRERLRRLQPELTLLVDQRATKRITTELSWAIENCSVMADHQIGQSMQDAMGQSADGKVV